MNTYTDPAGNEYRAIDGNNCADCAFDWFDDNCRSPQAICSQFERADGRDIIWIAVNNHHTTGGELL